ncbi:MAG: hypothetical protein WA061_02530 [Microgenomates group bacterium]
MSKPKKYLVSPATMTMYDNATGKTISSNGNHMIGNIFSDDIQTAEPSNQISRLLNVYLVSCGSKEFVELCHDGDITLFPDWILSFSYDLIDACWDRFRLLENKKYKEK